MGRNGRGAFVLVCALVLILPVGAWGQDAAGEKAAPAQPTPDASPQEPPPETRAERWKVEGYFSNRYWARWARDDHDQDYYGILSASVGTKEVDPVSAYVLGRVSADLDGRQNGTGFYNFDSAVDAKGRAVDARLYEGYVDTNRAGFLDLVRVGRQILHSTPETAYIDGAGLETRAFGRVRLQVGGYAGLPVRLYADDFFNGDVSGGAHVQSRPWRGVRLRGDWMHVSDDYFGDRRNDLGAVSLWQALAPRDFPGTFQVHGRYTVLDGESRDVTGRLTYSNPEWDFLAQFSYFTRLDHENQLVLEFDKFTQVLFAQVPYHDYRGLVSKGFGEYFALDGGAQIRQLDKDSEGSTFNREFSRFYLTESCPRLYIQGLSLSVTEELWYSTDPALESRYFFSAGGELAYRPSKKIRAAVGTNYSLFKDDYLLGIESQGVQTYYGRLRYRFAKSLRADFHGEVEHNSFLIYSQFRGTLTWEFGGGA